MNFSDEFRRLAERFRRIQADNPSDGQRQIIAAMAWGAKLVKRAAAAGIVELPPGLSWPTSPTRPSEDDSGLWAMVWLAVVEALQVSYRDELPSNAHALKWQDVAPGIRRGTVPAADWRLRSENYATAADWLARYVTTAGAAAGGPVGIDLQAHGTGPERAAGPAVKSKRRNINGMMLDVLQRGNEKARGWTARQWATHLRCSVSTVNDTPTWKELSAARKLAKAERALSKHRRSRSRRRTEQD